MSSYSSILHLSILDCIDDSVLIHDPDTGLILEINEAMLQMFRCSSADDAIGQPVSRFSFDASPYSEIERNLIFQKVISEGPQRFRWRAKRMDGTLFWADVSLTMCEESFGSFIVAVVRDISHLIKQESDFDNIRLYYHALFENLNSGIAIYDVVTDQAGNVYDFVFIDVNSQVEKIENVKREDLIGRSVMEIFPGIRQMGLLEVFQRVWETGVPEDFPVAMYKDNRIIGWRDNHIYKLPSGEIVAIYEDVTRQKQLSEALRINESILKAIFDAVPAAICLVDAKTRTFDWISPYLVKITGYSAEELLGNTPRIFYADDMEYRRVGNAYKLFEKHDLVELESVFRHKDGHLLNIFLAAVKLHNKVLVCIMDISAQKKAEAEKLEMERQLLHAQKLESLGVLASGIAHDFNNILTGIMGNAELLSFSLPPDDTKNRKYIHAIKTAVKRAAGICSQMLACAGKGDFIAKHINLSDSVSNILTIIKASRFKSIKLELDLEKNLPIIEGDVSQIEQIILNLVVNASEAIDKSGGTITISTGVMECDTQLLAAGCNEDPLPPGRYVFVEVTDTGCGMDEETKARMFEPFFTTKFTGRGLGMAAILGIVKRHNGTILIDTEAGEGTSIRVLIPEHVETGSEFTVPTGISDEELCNVSGVVLLVEDEEDLRDLGRQLLELSGFSVFTAGNNIECQEMFRQHQGEIDCVILDLTMLEIGWEDALEELRRLKYDMKVVIASSYSDKEMAERFAGQGVTGFLQKPYNLAEIQKVVCRAIAS